MKQFKALVVLALGFAFAVPAFAETQNVKVSGSLDAYGFYRDSYDFNKDGGSSAGAGDSEADAYFRSNTQVEVSADLTDNVSTVINLINQRDWDGGNTVSSTSAAQFDVDLDLAYVQMKEIFYSPLTLTVGRQDIWFGRGFIIGNNTHAWDYNAVTSADEYSVSTAFDAIRATLDFNPWTIDFIYSKISEGGNVNQENDIDLYGANVNYKFAEYNAVAEGYWFTEHDRAVPTDLTANQEGAPTHTIGGRVQFDPISQITLGAELAYQFGDYRAITSANDRDRSSWAADVFGTYRWDNTWKPELTLEYVHYSGEGDVTTNSTVGYHAWNGLYRGKFYTAIGDFRQFLYATDDTADQPATTNQNLFQVKGSLKPLEDLLLEASFTYFWLDENIAGRSDEIGWEIDTQVTYDYTEDVSFGLLAAWFNPGDFYSAPNDENATDIVSSVKVTF